MIDFVKENIKAHIKTTLIALTIVSFLVGFVFGAVLVYQEPKPIFQIEDVEMCLESMTVGKLYFHIDDIVENCKWPIPSKAICRFNVCGQSIDIEVTGIK